MLPPYGRVGLRAFDKLLLHAMAKPIFDLKDPFFASMTNGYREWMTEAVNLAYARDDSVRPIYALDERNQRLTQVGSGVLLSFGGARSP